MDATDLTQFSDHVPQNIDSEGFLDDIDPDLNLFNDNVTHTCHYFDESQFSRMIHNSSSDDHRGQLSFFHLNIRSAPKHFDHLTNFLSCLACKFSFIGLSETWHTANTVDLYGIPGYSCTQAFRNDKRGGGVSLYVRDSIPYHERPDFTVMAPFMECIAVEIDRSYSGTPQNIIVFLVYRPPNTDVGVFISKVSDFLQSAKAEKKLFLIMGDFNLDLIKYESHPGTNDFLELLYSHFLTPLITKPTRITEFSSTLLDNIFCSTSLCSRVMNSGILYSDISDHLPVFCMI